MEERKREEREFHDFLRGEELRVDSAQYRYYTSNRRFYSIARASLNYYSEWIAQRSEGKRVLDYACGDGHLALLAARHGASAVGIDISSTSVGNARQQAANEGLSERAAFHVMDAEKLEFEDDEFDIVCESGALHHLDLNRAFSEIARVLRPDGEALCVEALRDNFLIHRYRKSTPHLRTAYEVEHILRASDINMAQKFFEKVEVRYFHFASLAAVPFRSLPGFSVLLNILDTIDAVLLHIPLVQQQAWMAVFTLSRPIKRV